LTGEAVRAWDTFRLRALAVFDGLIDMA